MGSCCSKIYKGGRPRLVKPLASALPTLGIIMCVAVQVALSMKSTWPPNPEDVKRMGGLSLQEALARKLNAQSHSVKNSVKALTIDDLKSIGELPDNINDATSNLECELGEGAFGY